MRYTSSDTVIHVFLFIYFGLTFFYLFFVIEPELYFHHLQPPFILSNDFIFEYFKIPGGFSELAANFISQSFFYKISGIVILFLSITFIFFLSFKLLKANSSNKLNLVWSLLPYTLTVVLFNNYNFHFSNVVSLIVVLLLSLLFSVKAKNRLAGFFLYVLGSVICYAFCGSGYFIVYSIIVLISIFTGRLKRGQKWGLSSFILAFAYLYLQISYAHIYAIRPEQKYLLFYTKRPYFLEYTPSIMFYIYLFCIPASLLTLKLFDRIIQYYKRRSLKKREVVYFRIIPFSAILVIAYFSHSFSFQPEMKKIVETDFYGYRNELEKTKNAAMSLKEYSFIANLNYNLAVLKAGKINEVFFDFFQISGINSLYPDAEDVAERLFIATEFYYNVGYISEARHCAYEALAYYPFSLRALQNLVRIHLVTGEYKVADQYMNILDKGLVDRKFVKEFTPLLNDTALINTNKALLETRSFIPAEHELSPYIYKRLQALVKTNPKNKKAFDLLMLYYLLDSDFENFIALYERANETFNEAVDMYEEALLMYGDISGEPVQLDYKISNKAVRRYHEFKTKVIEFQGNDTAARNALYKDYGNTYMYFLHFLYPRVIKKDLTREESNVPSI